jgi:aldehyde:ferredoxin oxidoreductase
MMHVVNAAGLCMFGYLSFDTRCIPEFMEAITGWGATIDELLLIGERIANLRLLYNLREGKCPLEWKVPKRLLGHPPLEEGNLKGIELDEKTMIKEFLDAMDWDAKTMRPSAGKLEELGLAELA